MDGYIVVNEAAHGNKVLALSRGGKTRKNESRRPKWIEHNAMEECYVHSVPALRRAIRKKHQWTLEQSLFFFGATYNRKSTYAEPDAAPAIPFSDFKVLLFGQGAAD